MTKTVEACLQVLVPVWNPVHVEASKRTTPSESAKILLLGGDATHREWVWKSYQNSDFLRLDPTTTIDSIAKALNGRSFDQLVWIAPDISLTGNREISHELILEQQEQGVLEIFRIIKALLVLGYADKKLHWTIITGKTQQVSAGDPVEPTHAGVVGLVGSLTKEHPRWRLRLLDLDSLASVSAQECLSLPWDKQGNGLTYRRGEWFQHGLARVTAPPEETPLYRPQTDVSNVRARSGPRGSPLCA